MALTQCVKLERHYKQMIGNIEKWNYKVFSQIENILVILLHQFHIHEQLYTLNIILFRTITSFLEP